MKKPSFFGRIAKNLRFDDAEEGYEIEVRETKEPAREINMREPSTLDHSNLVTAVPDLSSKDEEIGELPVDVYQTANEIIIQTLIAGVLPEHLSISITRDTVIIRGKREENKSVSDDQYATRELYWGAFARTVTLPEEVEIDTSEAIERHGMLMIKLPKADRGRKTVLKIKSI